MDEGEVKKLIEYGARRIEEDPVTSQKVIGKALQKMPKTNIGLFNLGIALHQQKKIAGAIRAYRKSIEYSHIPLKEAINNLSQDLLLIGEWEEGFSYYEHRIKDNKHDYSNYERLFGEIWKGWGDERVYQKIVVIAEQGYGDTLQFCRLIQKLKGREKEVELFCQENLVQLLRRSTKIGKVTSTLTTSTIKTLWCPLMSLPDRLKIKKDEVEMGDYINAEDEIKGKWKKILNKDDSKYLIALHWQGNRKFERRLYSKSRSFPYNKLKRLNELNNVEFISIQKGQEALQKEEDIGLNYNEGQEKFDKTMDFRETAGVLANCDLLISSDSSVVHLAGGMGIPVWIALSWIPEWRWGLSSDMTPWYRNTRLFRQEKNNDWDSVFKNMLFELKKYVN